MPIQSWPGLLKEARTLNLGAKTMQKETNYPNRRTFLKSAVIAAAGCIITKSGEAKKKSNATTTLFDGKTLDGWIQGQNSATSFGGGDMADLAGLAKKLTNRSDAVSAFLSDQLDDLVKTELAAYSPSNTDVKAVRSGLAKNLNKIISGAALYEKT